MNLKLLIILILNILNFQDAFARSGAVRAGGRGFNRQLNRDLGRWQNDLADNAYLGVGGVAGIQSDATDSSDETDNIKCFLDGDCSENQKCSYNDGVTPGFCISKN